VGELQVVLGKLGFDASEILNATEGIVYATAASGGELADVASIVGTTLRGFKLETSEATRVADVMAAAFNNTALDLGNFGEAMKYISPIAAATGMNLEGIVAILGRLADAGVTGSLAGTAMRNILLRLVDPSSKLGKYLGGSVSNIEELIAALKGLRNEGISVSESLELTDRRAVTAFTNMIDNADKVEALYTSLKDVEGVAKDMSEVRMDNLKGDSLILKSVLQEMSVSIGGDLNPSLRSFVQSITEFFQMVGRNKDSVYAIVKGFTLMATALTILTVTNRIAASMAFKTALAFIKKGQAAIFARTQIDALKLSMTALARSNWLGLLLTVVTSLVLALKLFKDRTEQAAVATSKYSDEIGEEKTKLDVLFGALKKAEEGTKERVTLINRINKEYKEYLPSLLSEKSTNEDIAKAYDAINKNLEKNIALKIKEREITDIMTRSRNEENEALKQLDTAVKDSSVRGALRSALQDYAIKTSASDKGGLFVDPIQYAQRFKGNTEALDKWIEQMGYAEGGLAAMDAVWKETDAKMKSIAYTYGVSYDVVKQLAGTLTGIKTKTLADIKELADELDAYIQGFKGLEGGILDPMTPEGEEGDPTDKGYQNRKKAAEKQKLELLEDTLYKRLALLDYEYSESKQALGEFYDDMSFLDNWYADEKIRVTSEWQEEVDAIREKGRSEYMDNELAQFDQEQELAYNRFRSVKRSERELTLFDLEQQKERLEHILKYGLYRSNAEMEIIKAIIGRIKQEMADVESDETKDGRDIFDLLGLKLDDDQKDALKDYADYMIDQINRIVDARVEAAQKAVDAAEREIEAARTVLEQEREDRAAGYANSVELAERELEMKKRSLEKAKDMQEKALKAQRAMQSIERAGNLVTGISGIVKAWSANPVVMAGLIATMLSLYAAGEVAAVKAAKSTKYAEGGYEEIDGASHSAGGVTIGYSGRRRLEAEGGEGMAIFNKRATRRMGRRLPQIVEQINKGQVDVFSRHNTNDFTQINVASSSPELQDIKRDIMALLLLEQNKTDRTQVGGKIIEKYKNVTRIINVN
jgi:TP901 family phage tail tape measure protein